MGDTAANSHNHIDHPFMEFLNRLVLDEEKIVTATSVLRRTPLNAVQAQELFKAFLNANKANPRVNATYYLLGSLKEALDKRQCTIVRSEELDGAKQRLDKIHICSIFSVQACEIKSLETLFNLDWMDEDEDGEDPSLFKGFLKCGEAEKMYKKWSKMEKAKKHIKTDRERGNEKLEDKKTNPGRIDQIEVPKKGREKEINIMEDKTPSPKKGREKEINIMEDKTPSPKKRREQEISDLEDKTPSPKKKRGPKRILIESDDEKAEIDQHSNDGENNGDDIFCTGDSEEEMGEKSEVEEEEDKEKRELSKKKTKTTRKRKSDEKEEEEDEKEEEGRKGGKKGAAKKKREGADIAKFTEKTHPENTQKPRQKEEEVTETYLDEDGMLVTRTTTKVIETPAGVGDENSRGSMGSSSSALAKRSAAQIIPEAAPKSKHKQLQQKGKPKGTSGGGKQTNLFNYFKR